MNKLKCDICGGQIEIQPDKRGLCLNCGTSYSLTTMKEMFSGVKVSVTGSSEDVEQWHEILDRYYAAGDFREAERIVKKILQAVPSDERANSMYDDLQILKHFEVKNGVIKSYSGTAKSISIPDVIHGIEAHTFARNQYLEEVILPDSITSIEECLFLECKNLRRVKLPSNLRTIAHSAFSSCNALIEAIIPNSVTFIGFGAFRGCSNLRGDIRLTDMTSIESDIFSDCANLTSIVISGNITSIGEAAFKNCSALTSVTIPDGVESIGKFAFSGCQSISSIEIPYGVKTIGYGAFSGCKSLRRLIIPDSVTQIEAFISSYHGIPFDGCNNLEYVEYPDRFSSYILEGSKYYDIMQQRKKSGRCPKCNVKLSFWNGRCTKCGKTYQ